MANGIGVYKCVNKRFFQCGKPYKYVCERRKPGKNTLKVDEKAKFQS